MVRSDSADEETMLNEEMEMEDEEDLDVEGGGPRGLGRRRWTETLDSPTLEKTGNADVDRRIRRQIANCNERRRMQSINAGFQSLRALLPRKDGEKLSKAAILQQTAELIQHLRRERSALLEKTGTDDSPSPSNIWKRPKMERESDSFDFSYPSSSSNSNDSTVAELQQALERERLIRIYYEQKLKAMGSSGSTPTSTPLSPVAVMAAALQPCLAPPSTPLEGGSPPNGVIRPTPTQPLRVDVSLANLVSLAVRTPVVGGLGESPPPLPHPPVAAASALATRSLNAILEAIKHLEGGAFSASPPPTSHANLLVR